MNKVTILILVAGKSTRFKHTKSKIFHELGGLPIIDHVYSAAKNLSKEIVFICNKENMRFFEEKIYKFKIYHSKKTKKEQLTRYCQQKKIINKKFKYINSFGDVPLIKTQTLRKMINNYFNNNKNGSMLAFNSSNPFGYGRVLKNNNKVKSVIEEINADSNTKKINLCNSGVMLCKYSTLFSYINKINDKNLKKEKYLTDIFKIAYDNNKSFTYTLCEEDEVLGVNSLSDFNKVDKIHQINLINKAINQGVKILNPDTFRMSFDTKIGKNVEIEPYVFLKKE